MLSSALIGCFTVWLKVELCPDWLFYSAGHFSSSHIRKETQGKLIFQYFLTQLYCWVIILDIKCGHQGVAIKGIVLPKMKILSSFTHPQVVPNLY